MPLTIGEQLKQAREQRGLTLEQAAQSTHIRKHYLEALENDQREALPSVVQGRGFLRLYAGLLDLPAAPLLAAWDNKPAEPPAVPTADGDLQPAQPTGSSAEEQAPLPQQEAAAGLAAANLAATGIPPENFPPSMGPVAATESIEDVPSPAYAEPGVDAPAAGGSRLIFREIGVKLRQQRESLGLSLAEVERYTRLRTFYVQALEDGRIDDLPSPVQGRGMLSNYAAFLNMDEEKLLLRFAEGLQTRRIERLPQPEPQSMFNAKKRPARQAPFWKRFLTPDLIFGVGMAGIILFFALWTAARINSMRTAEAQPTAPAISEILLTPDALQTGSPTARTPEAEVSGTPVPVVEVESTPGLEETPIDSSTVVAGNPVNPLPDNSEPTAGTATLSAINEDPLQVYIVARQRAYLRILTDDKVKFLGRVVPGNAYAFSASNRIELSTGSAGALQVFYNQIDLGTLGKNGEVANLIFSLEGVYTPTPAFTATSTPTQPATLTPVPTATPPATATITPFVP